MWKAMARTWDLEGFGTISLDGACFGLLIGAPLSALFSFTLFNHRKLPLAGVWTCWAMTCTFAYSSVLSFFGCVLWLVGSA